MVIEIKYRNQFSSLSKGWLCAILDVGWGVNKQLLISRFGGTFSGPNGGRL